MIVNEQAPCEEKYSWLYSDRPEKKFLEQEDNENIIGVMDESVDQRNKIEEKQEDMFGAHQIKQNILHLDQDTPDTNNNAFLDFNDDPNQHEEPAKEQASIQQQDPPKNKRKRERGRREVKKFDSDGEHKE